MAATPSLTFGRRGPGASAAAVLRICFSFDGRLDRDAYLTARSVWYAVNVLAFYELWRQILQAVLAHQFGAAAPWALLALGLFIAGQWVTLAMQVKRWHDRDRSAIWACIGLVPLVGPIWTLVELMFLEGTPGPNRFGPAPNGDSRPAPARQP